MQTQTNMASARVSLSPTHVKVYIWILSKWHHKSPGPVCSIILLYMWSMGALKLHKWSWSKCLLSRLFSLYLFNKPNFLKHGVKVNCWPFSVYTITNPLTNDLYITLSTGKEAAGEPDLISRLGVQWRDTASAPKPLRTLDPSRTTFYLTHSVFLNHSIDAPSRTHPSKPVSLKMLILSSKCICCFVLEPVCIIPDVSQFMQSFVSLLDHLLQPLFFFFLVPRVRFSFSL